MRITIHGRLAPDKEEFIWLSKEIRRTLLQRFSLFDRGPMQFAMLSALYGARYTRLMQSYLGKKQQEEDG